MSEPEEGEELEEGEVTDEEERRPEENEPKPVCRFYTRGSIHIILYISYANPFFLGQCTWGVSCRFLHPGVTDKGNYTMFDMVRPVSAQPSYGHPPFHEGFRELRPPIPHVAPHHHASYPVPARPAVASADSESAWERGLRFAKEMMRKANKRKEQDIDFEDKKMNLSLSQDELEKDNYYTKDKSSPEVNSKKLVYIKILYDWSFATTFFLSCFRYIHMKGKLLTILQLIVHELQILIMKKILMVEFQDIVIENFPRIECLIMKMI